MEHSFVDDSAAAIDPEAIAQAEDDDDEAEAEAAEDGPSEPAAKKPRPGGHGRRKIEIEYIEDTIRRHLTFSKRTAGRSKKAAWSACFCRGVKPPSPTACALSGRDE